MSADLKLRTIHPHGDYDIRVEQNVPDFAAAVRHLGWFLESDDFGEDLDTYAVKTEAVNKYKADTGYQEHGTTGDYYYLAPNSAVFKGIVRLAPLWQDDTTKPEATAPGQRLSKNYKARITYDILEIHDLSQGPGEDDWEYEEVPLGEVSVDVNYSVVLYSKYVSD